MKQRIIIVLTAMTIIFISAACNVKANIFKQFEEYIQREESRRAQAVLESDLLGSSDSPKEIEIYCPTVILFKKCLIQSI
jgi:uncharacterized protein YxeA